MKQNHNLSTSQYPAPTYEQVPSASDQSNRPNKKTGRLARWGSAAALALSATGVLSAHPVPTEIEGTPKVVERLAKPPSKYILDTERNKLLAEQVTDFAEKVMDKAQEGDYELTVIPPKGRGAATEGEPAPPTLSLRMKKGGKSFYFGVQGVEKDNGSLVLEGDAPLGVYAVSESDSGYSTDISFFTSREGDTGALWATNYGISKTNPDGSVVGVGQAYSSSLIVAQQPGATTTELYNAEQEALRAFKDMASQAGL